MKTNEDGRKIPIRISAGSTSKFITEYETYLLENHPTPERTDKPIAPPTNTKKQDAIMTSQRSNTMVAMTG